MSRENARAGENDAVTDDETRLARYAQLRRDLPELFTNPPDGLFEILLEPHEVAAVERAAARRLVEAGLPAAWARTGVVFEDQYGLAVRDAVRLPDGRLGTYVRRLSPGNAPGVVVLPLLGGDVLLVRNFRHATRRWHLELPRGFGTPGCTPEDDARRELWEEVGAVAGSLVDLGVVYPDTGVSATPTRLFLTEVDGYGVPARDEGIAEIRPTPPAELAALISGGELTDGYTIAAYARAVLRGLLPSR